MQRAWRAHEDVGTIGRTLITNSCVQSFLFIALIRFVTNQFEFGWWELNLNFIDVVSKPGSRIKQKASLGFQKWWEGQGFDLHS